LYANKQRIDSTTSQPTKETILSRLSSATVAVIGLGGVGSWAAEALVRSGVGNIVLIDLDDICISNTNRQLHAMSSTVGKMKIGEMKRRLVDINPQCNVTLVHDFVSDWKQ
jgi:tRNA A37 threonylcarbamoyladenosine dehydratase